MKIAIIEDDLVIANILKKELMAQDYEVVMPENFLNIVHFVKQVEPHMVLLDINLPGENGYYWCNEIRKFSSVPIIFISAINEKFNKLMAIQMGGDDFISKPIDLQLTLSKVHALLRRTYEFAADPETIKLYGNILLDIGKSILAYQDQSISLTHTELQIMTCLFESKGNYVARDDILDFCWQNNQFIDDNTLTVNVTRIRKKLKGLNLGDLIQTKKNMGYRLVEEVE